MHPSAKHSKNQFPTSPPVGAGVGGVGERSGRGSNVPAAFFLTPDKQAEQRRRLKALPDWQRIQIWRLCRIFTWAEKNIGKGWKLKKAFQGPIRRWRGRTYENGQPVLPSYKTILAKFYRWRHGGCVPLAILPNYRPPRKIHRQELAAFINAAKMPAITSFRQALKRIAIPGAGEAAFRKALRPGDYDRINRSFAMRRQSAGLLRRAQRLVNKVNSWPKKGVESR